jgi:hypothetical protein
MATSRRIGIPDATAESIGLEKISQRGCVPAEQKYEVLSAGPLPCWGKNPVSQAG